MSPRYVTLVLGLVLATTPLAGCDSDASPQSSWRDVSPDDAPPLLEERRGHPALADLEGIYLGQPRKEARETLKTRCGDAVLRRDDGAVGGEAYFLGCRIDDDGPVRFIRVGFWPRLRDRVATLEVKRSTVPPGAVLGVVREHFDAEPDNAVVDDRIIQLEYPNYRFLADWDQGLDGPTHLTVGFDPAIPLERAAPSD